MEIEPNIFKRNHSTQKLRALKEAALLATMELSNRDKRLFIVESQTLHFFSDCCLCMTEFVIGQAVLKHIESSRKVLKVYTKDLVTWKEYTDQFEPKEGYHHAYEYKPHDSSFPTREW